MATAARRWRCLRPRVMRLSGGQSCLLRDSCRSEASVRVGWVIDLIRRDLGGCVITYRKRMPDGCSRDCDSREGAAQGRFIAGSLNPSGPHGRGWIQVSTTWGPIQTDGDRSARGLLLEVLAPEPDVRAVEARRHLAQRDGDRVDPIAGRGRTRSGRRGRAPTRVVDVREAIDRGRSRRRARVPREPGDLGEARQEAQPSRGLERRDDDADCGAPSADSTRGALGAGPSDEEVEVASALRRRACR